MKLPNIKQFEEILFCNVHRKDCAKVDRKKFNCKGLCEQCSHSEKIFNKRFT